MSRVAHKWWLAMALTCWHTVGELSCSVSLTMTKSRTVGKQLDAFSNAYSVFHAEWPLKCRFVCIELITYRNGIVLLLPSLVPSFGKVQRMMQLGCNSETHYWCLSPSRMWLTCLGVSDCWQNLLWLGDSSVARITCSAWALASWRILSWLFSTKKEEDSG